MNSPWDKAAIYSIVNYLFLYRHRLILSFFGKKLNEMQVCKLSWEVVLLCAVELTNQSINLLTTLCCFPVTSGFCVLLDQSINQSITIYENRIAVIESHPRFLLLHFHSCFTGIFLKTKFQGRNWGSKVWDDRLPDALWQGHYDFARGF